MEYQEGRTGRVLYARLDDGDDLHDCIRQLAAAEGVRCAWFQVFGGLKRAGVVTGPREPVMPPEPVWRQVDDAREILGFGTVLPDTDQQPLIHMHAAMGHHGETLTGCLRRDSSVYLVIELVMVEITGIDVTRPWFQAGGFNRPTFQKTEDRGQKPDE